MSLRSESRIDRAARAMSRIDRGAGTTSRCATPLRLLALSLLAACASDSGLVSVSLTTAPGSTLLDGVETLRLEVTHSHQIFDVHRTSSGFDLAFDLPATGEATSLVANGLDAMGAPIATGASPPFPLGPLTAKIVIYMAAPNSLAAAPTMLSPARTELGVGSLPYGAIFAGGRDAAGAASDAVAIYNAFDHTLVGGQAMPAPRSSIIVAAGANGIVFLLGGRDTAGTTTGTLWRFDTNVAPAGQYLDFGDKAGFARAGEIAAPLGNDRFLISGAPVAELAGVNGSLTARTEVAMLPPTGASLLATDGSTVAIFAGASIANGVVRFRNGAFDMPSIPAAARTGHAVLAVPGGKILVVCGGADALRIDAATEAVETFPNLPTTSRTDCAVAATPRHVLVAGGDLGGTVATDAELYDAATFAKLATIPLVVPRKDARAIALPNDQILIAGGVDASGAPIATLELFTPDRD